MKRVFLGIKIPQGVSKEVSLFQKELKKIDIDAKFVEEENLHINLKFFGSQSDEIIDKIIDVVSNVVKEFQGFKVTLKGVGAFPSQNFIRVVWIGVLSKELHELFNRLEERFVEIGILSEGREFTPHLTLARLRSQKNKNLLIEKIRSSTNKEFGEFFVSEIYLIESKLSPKGPTYSDVKVFRLGK